MPTLVEKPRPSESEREQQRKDDSVPTAELAECTCPDFCERDHDTD